MRFTLQRSIHASLLFTMVIVHSALATGDEPATAESAKGDKIVGRRVPHVVLPDAAGKQVGLDDFNASDCLVVVFMGTQCPIGNAYVPVLNRLQSEYGTEKLQIVGINANPGDTAKSVKQHVEEYKVAFPVLVDPEQSAVQLFGATRTCEAFLLDGRRVVRYRGRIDDRFGYTFKRDEPRRSDLREAIDELLAGKQVSVPATETAGCLITPRQRKLARSEVTYTEHVAPLLAKHCRECHRPGTAAPFSLLTYEDAANWSAMIGEVTVQRRMPPWHADPRFGEFSNERRLSQDEIDTLLAWVQEGAPRGEDSPKTEAATGEAEYADGWTIGRPDVVFQMPEEFTVPADGTVKYQYYRTKTNFTEDVWVQAAECRPGNRAVVHHIIVFYREPGARGAPVWIAATAPGADPLVLPPGLGRKIPAGAELVWQMHYTPTGKEENDRSEIGLIFCKEPPKHNVMNYGISNRFFRIPPGEANHEVISNVPAIKDTVVLSFLPHMHLRGKDFQYEVLYPDGRKEIVLSVPQYDFNWQHVYRLETPLRVPKGSTIRCVAHFDNSADNPANPDPTKTVRWGDQTWEEMMIGYVNFYWDDFSKEEVQQSVGQ